MSGASGCQPDNAQVHYNLGVISYGNDRTDDAVRSFQKAEELNPEFASAFYQLGPGFVKKGEFAGAVEAFETFLLLEPDAPEAELTKRMIEELKKRLPETS